MANPEHLKILEKGGKDWNIWRIMDDTVPDLSNANLAKADLIGINFEGVRLQGVMFNGANLKYANFVGARLLGATFTGANLLCSDFSHAALDSVSFLGTNMASANFHKSELGFTSFASTNLREATGLETCLHLAPSSVDFNTLKLSGLLPKAFLQGCGLPDDLIENIPLYLNQTSEFYSCFISYGHEDKAFAILLHDRLQRQGIRCWLDEHQLLPGDDIHDGIDEGVRLWDKVLLCASKSSLTSWWVDGEINRAFQKEAQIMKERGKKVLALIPLNLDGFMFSDEYKSGKKAEIKSRIAANFVGWKSDQTLFNRELGKIILALNSDKTKRVKPPQSKL